MKIERLVLGAIEENCYIIYLDDGCIIVDPGTNDVLHYCREKQLHVTDILLTHGHYDHIAGLPELPRATKLLGHKIDIWASLETMTELKQCYGYLFKENQKEEPDSKSLRWNVAPDKGTFLASGIEFETILFQHHHIHSSAFRYKNFAYVTDWQAIPENIGSFLDNLDTLIIECNNGMQPEENGHSDIHKIREIKESFNPKNIYLTHLSSRIDTDEFQKILPDNCHLAYDGMQLEL